VPARASLRLTTRMIISLGVVLALPLLLITTATGSAPTTTTSSTSTTSTIPGTTTTSAPVNTVLPWPAQDSAAVAIPSLEVSAGSPNQPRVPIASLTKLMTAWVVLQKIPLAVGQIGSCLTVNAQDVAFFHQNLSIQESTVKIVVGERLCENTLFRGLFVHSAGDYAEMLVRLTGMNNAAFLKAMNADATALGLSQTHYADYTGISTGDLSTAQDVATLTVDLMTSQPFIDSIVSLTKVHLPVAGWVGSYTPYIGSDGVVGVKSGYTLASGGCVALAINVTIGGVVVPTYEVVLSQPGANALDVAGAHALQLMRALRPSLTLVRVAEVKTVAWIGSPSLVTPTTTTTTTTTTSSTTTTIPTI